MGCCVSRDADVVQNPQASLSARALNEGSASGNDASGDAAQRARNRRGGAPMGASAAAPTQNAHQNTPNANRVNQPLRKHKWASRTARSLPRLPGTDARGRRNHVLPTRSALARERAEFFDTRVNGRPEVWMAIKCVCGLLRATDDGADGLAVAQGILSAAGVTVPTGDIAGGAYDEQGNFYHVPGWVVAEPPASVLRDAEAAEAEQRRQGIQRRGGGGQESEEIGSVNAATDGDEIGGDAIDASDGDDSDDSPEASAKHSQLKEVSLTESKDTHVIVARLSEDARDVAVRVRSADTVKRLARRIAEEAGLPATKRVRIAYMGRILDEDGVLEDGGWVDGQVVNAFVFGR